LRERGQVSVARRYKEPPIIEAVAEFRFQELILLAGLRLLQT